MPNKQHNYIKKFISAYKRRNRVEKVQVIFILLMQAAFIVAITLSIYEQSWLTLFVAIAALIVVWIPPLLARNMEAHLPLEFEFLLNVFIYSSIFLGEFRGFYIKFPWWDMVLHAGAGITLGFIGFLILYSLVSLGRLRSSPLLASIFSFSFALALGTLWEIFEYIMDSNFGLNMQKSGLQDTMWDLIVNASGALLASLFGYFYLIKIWKKGGLTDRLIKKFD